MATARLDPKAGAWTAVVSTPPFGTVAEPTTASITTAPSPTLPFTVLRGNNDRSQPMILIEHDGQRFVASGLTVYADYLIQLERDQVIFTYLPSAVRQTLPLPAVTAQGRDLPQAGATTYWSAYRTSSKSLKTTKALEVTSAEEEAERD